MFRRLSLLAPDRLDFDASGLKIESIFFRAKAFWTLEAHGETEKTLKSLAEKNIPTSDHMLLSLPKRPQQKELKILNFQFSGQISASVDYLRFGALPRTADFKLILLANNFQVVPSIPEIGHSDATAPAIEAPFKKGVRLDARSRLSRVAARIIEIFKFNARLIRLPTDSIMRIKSN